MRQRLSTDSGILKGLSADAHGRPGTLEMVPSNAYIVRVKSRRAYEVAFIQRFHCFRYLSGAKHIFRVRLLRAAATVFLLRPLCG